MGQPKKNKNRGCNGVLKGGFRVPLQVLKVELAGETVATNCCKNRKKGGRTRKRPEGKK